MSLCLLLRVLNLAVSSRSGSLGEEYRDSAGCIFEVLYESLGLCSRLWSSENYYPKESPLMSYMGFLFICVICPYITPVDDPISLKHDIKGLNVAGIFSSRNLLSIANYESYSQNA